MGLGARYGYAAARDLRVHMHVCTVLTCEAEGGSFHNAISEFAPQHHAG